ncbi:MAG: hypothetical protein O3A14_07730 [Cyanobacteria bacterium]|nr:hypothetical protein [Cyanobacteriota bacterium]
MSTLVIALISNSRWRSRIRPPWRRVGLLGLWALLALISGCRQSAIATPRQIIVQQTWELEPGQQISGFRVVASLGDITIDTRGHPIYAPFAGEVELSALGNDCIFFSSPEVPAYLFRYCGVRRPHLGPITLGSRMGSARFLHFSTLRRQPDGTWTIVEPSRHVLERSLRIYP